MADVPAGILQLVETFDRNIEAYRSQEYNEAQLRREFIDPFFEELGWDITNKQGFAPQYREVIHENSIKVSGETKAPDYCFRIGGFRKFFLEAKKPAVNIKADPDPAYQLRRYAWSAKLPLSILTNFETFAVYDCQIRPKHTDRPTTARIINLTYKEYLDKWNEIASIFSKDAVLKGSFDKYAISPKGKRGTTTVDTEFLAEIENWRKMLAQIIALRNRSLSIREINFAVQQTIDRILFLRLCEDRGIEPYGQLRATSSGDRNYPRLCEIFEKADQKYNSGLFHFHDEPGRAERPDELTLNLNIDDTPIKWILYHLYYPQSPYEFSVLPAEILGNVYEQFLGKVIRLTPGHRAVVEEKPEVKKAGGIYYTPSYIVDYIVKNTVGKLCEGKTPKQIEKLKILDPACGSGSFLLGAYTYLLDYHRDWYTENDPENWLKKKNPPIYEVTASRHCEDCSDEAISNYRLTVGEKKRILLNNIFGVDIDSQAVEVTKLSLLLKVLEGENQQTLENQYRLFHERALPDLGNNIKCGNSLIGPDFYDTIGPESITEELRRKINAFDWQPEFPQIFNRQNPSFDAVIGNPPYIPIEMMDPNEKYYFKKHHPELQRKYDSSIVFILAMLRKLNHSGRLGFISSITWQTGENFRKLREYLFTNAGVDTLINLPFDVFEKAYVDTGVYILSAKPNDSYLIYRFPKKGIKPDLSNVEYKCVPTDLITSPDYKIILEPKAQAIFARVYVNPKFIPLGLITISTQGLAANKFTTESTPKDDNWYPFIPQGQVYRYALSVGKLLFADLNQYPSLKPFYDKSHKLLLRRLVNRQDRLMATYINDRLLFKKDINPFIITDPTRSPFFVLGILNSKLMSYLYVNTSSIATKDDFRQTTLAELRKLPIRTIDFSNPEDAVKHGKMVKLVERMLDLHKQLAAAKIPNEKTRIQREIDITDKQIDRLVYDLYGLTEEEIKIVEESATGSQATR